MENIESDTLLAEYQMMQYAQLFDVKNRNDAWYEP